MITLNFILNFAMQLNGLKPCPHCRRKRRLSPKTTICNRKRRLSQKTATVAVFCDSRRFRWQIVAEIGDYSR